MLSEKGEALPGTEASLGVGLAELPEYAPVLERLPEWFAVSIAPRHEKRVSELLLTQQIETFLPLYRSVRRWKNRCRVALELPLFPGYLFVRILRGERGQVLVVPGVLAIVGSRREPTPLPAHEIEALRSGLHLHKFEPHPYLVVGERARITSGPLAGMEGVVIRKKKSFRVVLTVEQIMQSVAVEVDAEQLEKVPRRHLHPGVSSPSRF
ncbi:MAG: transcription termination/antitermination protein NusG [Terriglobales bacterium]